ncbi:hypothetical protein DFH07DRAFT_1035568, partial [Mycena maculata]
MSVQELEARLEKISADIDLQRELLKKLENSKILVQRQLNAVRDPVARLPLEISSEIFIQSLSPRPEPGSQNIPMLLLNVCNTWTNIALSTPRLWAVIHVDFPQAESFRRCLETWFRRAGNCPLSMSGVFDAGVRASIRPHVHRLKYLEIGLDDDETVALLAGMSPGPLPFLEKLVLQYGYRGSYSASRILEFLRLTPNLLELRLDIHTLIVPESPEHVVLPALLQMMFGGGSNIFGNDSADEILRCLSLPNLRTLYLFMEVLEPHDLIEFLQRSLPPLQDLIIGNLPFAELQECLRLVPSLTQLELWRPKGLVVEEVCTALADSPTDLLPNLRSLTIHLDWSTIISAPFCTVPLRALSGRRSQLTYFKMVQTRKRPWAPDPEPDWATFRQLAADGMEIYVGTEERNFIS